MHLILGLVMQGGGVGSSISWFLPQPNAMVSY
jgi:hypothetical protein